jgi:Fic family protein
VSGEERRHSVASDPEIISDPIKQAEAEARNGLRQFDISIQMVHQALERQPFKLRPSMIQQLHRAALEGLSGYAGNWRPGGVRIEKSKHEPPPAHLVAELVEELCEYVNSNWDRTAIHLAAYCMWRLNWIHPFADGNGRTSRALSYMILCIKSGKELPGYPTIPFYIVDHRQPYFEALDAADAALKERGVVDLELMEKLLSQLLAKQLARFHKDAGGHINLPDDHPRGR